MAKVLVLLFLRGRILDVDLLGMRVALVTGRQSNYIHNKWSKNMSRISASAIVLLSLSVVACEPHQSAICQKAPEYPIVGFKVEITTGDDGTECDIEFCHSVYGFDNQNCHLLDSIFDDFEEYDTESYSFDVAPIAVGKLEEFEVRVADCGFMDNSWNIAALKVWAQLESGDEQLLYEEDEITQYKDLHEGDSYLPKECDYTKVE